MDFSKEISRAQDQWYELFDPSSEKLPSNGYIRDPVLGHIKLDPVDFLVFGAPPFQRLRGIAQLSFVDRIYPGANHTRFEHCVGVATIVRKLFDTLESNKSPVKLKKNEVLATRLAAYFHDIGHLPFSHLLEPLFRGALQDNYSNLRMSEESNKPHELLGHMIIESNYFRDLIARAGRLAGVSIDQKLVASLAMGTGKVPTPKLFLREIIHGDFDCDRLDYLVRDAYYCGVPHGNVDIERIIETFRIVRRDPGFHLGIDVSGLPSVEMMYACRHTMYNTVYHHHTSRIIECMIQRVIRRFLSEGGLKLEQLIQHTDASLLELVKITGSKVCRSAIERFESRKLPKKFFEKRLFEIPKLRRLKPGVATEDLVESMRSVFRKINNYFGVLENAINFEEQCAREVYPKQLRPGALMLDCPQLSLPEAATIDVRLPVMFGPTKTRPIVDVSPIVRTIAYEGTAFVTTILLAGIQRQMYKSAAIKSVTEKLIKDFGLRL